MKMRVFELFELAIKRRKKSAPKGFSSNGKGALNGQARGRCKAWKHPDTKGAPGSCWQLFKKIPSKAALQGVIT
jgi:hypothetical protein